MTIYIEEEGSRLNDYDFEECLKYAPFNKEDVEEILACSPGEADGDHWYYIVKLKDGKFGYVTGSCDYSGWGCQEDGDGKIADTLIEAVNYAERYEWRGPNEDLRKNLLEQAEGKAPYGLKL